MFPTGSRLVQAALVCLLALAVLVEPPPSPGQGGSPVLQGTLSAGDGTTPDFTLPAPVAATPQSPCGGNTITTRARPDGSYEISSNLANGCEYGVGAGAAGYFSEGAFVLVNGTTVQDFTLYSNKAWLAGSVIDAVSGQGLPLRGGDVFTPVSCDGINPNCFSTADGSSYAFGTSPGFPGERGGLFLERPPGVISGPGQRTFTIVATHPGYFSETTESLTLVSGQIVSGHNFQLYPTQGNIRGTVVDAASNQPIPASANLSIIARPLGSSFGPGARISGENYTFAGPTQPPDWGLPVVRAGSSGPGSQPYILEARASGYVSHQSPPLLVESGRSVNYPIRLSLANSDLGRCGHGCEHQAGSPINLTNGNTWIEQQDYSLPGLGGGLELVRTWNSLWQGSSPIEESGMFGHSWRSNYEERLSFPRPDTLKYWRGDGSSWQFAFDSATGSYSLVAPPDEHALLEFDAGTGLFTLTLLDGSKKLFNNAGFLVALEDRNLNRTTLSYDGVGRLIEVSDAAGRSLQFSYGSGRQVVSVRDATGVIATYSYFSLLLTQVRYADNSTLSFTYVANLITAVRDTEGKLLEAHTYDSQRRGLTSERADGVDRITISYPFPGLTRLTDSRGNTTEYRYFSIGPRRYVAGLAGPGCSSCGGRGNQAFAYDTRGNRTASTDALNRTTEFRYDAMGNLTERRVELEPGTTLIWRFTYNSFGQVVTSTDPLDNTTGNVYDARGNLLSTTTPSPDGVEPGSTTSFDYDSRGQLIRVLDPRGNPTEMTYTAAGLVASITDARGNTTEFEYDARGNRTAVIDALGSRTEFSYDLMNRLKKIIYPDGTETNFDYDLRGRRTSVTDANGNTTTYTYDDADRLIAVTDALGNVTRYAYDTESNLTAITDALGRVTRFDYDADSRVTEVIFPSGLAETYAYDAVGNLLGKTDRKGQTISYSYDALNRLVRKSYPDSTGVDYTYDGLSRLTDAVDPTGSYGFSYDNLGRLIETSTSYTHLPGRTFVIGYRYDAGNSPSMMVDPTGSATTYEYDELDRLISLTDPSGERFEFGYDILSRRIELKRPNAVHTSYEYDNRSRLRSVLHRRRIHVIDGASYSYDAEGNRTSRFDHRPLTDEHSPVRPPKLRSRFRIHRYSYDPIYQLTQVLQDEVRISPPLSTDEPITSFPSPPDIVPPGVAKFSYLQEGEDGTGRVQAAPVIGPDIIRLPPRRVTETYTYDNVGNRLSSSGLSPYIYNESNHLLSTPSVSYIYDANGNLTTKTDTSATTTYSWDFESRLVAINLPTGHRVSFKYDPFGRRIQKGPTTYIYDRDNLVSELDSAGNVAVRYTQGLVIDEPLAVRRNGVISYYHADGLGSITSLTDATGVLVSSYAYDSFGNLVGSTGDPSNSFRYTAREYDAESNLYYYRSRYYDPSVGRFLSEDNIRLQDGINFYVYVSNRPVNFFDPFGEQKCDVQVKCRGAEVAALQAVTIFTLGRKKYLHCYMVVDDAQSKRWLITAGPVEGDMGKMEVWRPEGLGKEADNFPKDKSQPLKCPNPIDCEKVECLKAQADAYKARYPHYDPRGKANPNSNSFIDKISSSCGINVTFPKRAIGWDYFRNNPDPNQ